MGKFASLTYKRSLSKAPSFFASFSTTIVGIYILKEETKLWTEQQLTR